MSMTFGLSRNGWLSFRRQEIFALHYLHPSQKVSRCSQVMYHAQKFEKLPINALLCERCLETFKDAPPTDPGSQEGQAT